MIAPHHKRTIQSLDVAQKLEIIDYAEKNISVRQRDLAGRFGIPQSTLSRILAKRSQLRRDLESGNVGLERKRMRKSKYEDVSKALLAWYHSSNVNVSSARLRDKAEALRRSFGYYDSQISDGWLSRWKARHGIVLGVMNGAHDIARQNTSHTVLLRLHESHITSSYESDPMHVTQGEHRCSLIANDRIIKMEPVTVEPQTSEMAVCLVQLKEESSTEMAGRSGSAADTAAADAAAIQRSTQYEELVRRQLNYSSAAAESSASNSQSLPVYETSDATSDDRSSAGCDMLDDQSAASSGRKQDIREVQDYLEKLDQKRGILERHASAELVRPSAIPYDSVRRRGSASLPLPALADNSSSDSSRRAVTSTPKSGAIASEGSQQQQQQQISSTTSQQQPALRATLSTPRAAPINLVTQRGQAGASVAVALPRPQGSLTSVSAQLPKTTVASIGIFDLDSSRPSETAISSASSATATAPLVDSTAAIAVLRMRLAAREDEVQRLSTEVHTLRETNQNLRNSKMAPESRSGGAETAAEDKRLSAVLREKAELERNYDNLLREKENVTTELRKAHQQLESVAADSAAAVAAEVDASDDLAASQPQTLTDGGDSERLLSYRPDNPNALQRKIDDLECQIQDLHEANETACDEVQRLECENQLLCEEIGSLKGSHEVALFELEAECRKLQEKVAQLQKKPSPAVVMSADDLHLHSEIQQLRIDLRALREKNHVLTEENIRLRETLSDSKRIRQTPLSDQAAKDTGLHSRSNGSLPPVDPPKVDTTNNHGDMTSANGKAVAMPVTSPKTSLEQHTHRQPQHKHFEPPAQKSDPAIQPPTTSSNLGSSKLLDAQARIEAGRRCSRTAMLQGDHSATASQARFPTEDDWYRDFCSVDQQRTKRASSPATRSDMSDSTTVLLASYTPPRTFNGSTSVAVPSYSNGHDFDLKSDRLPSVAVQRLGNWHDVPPFFEDDGRSDVTADILQDATSYFGSKQLPMSGLNGLARSDQVKGRSAGSSSSSSSLSSLGEQHEIDDCEAGQNGRQNSGLRSVTSPLQVTQHNRSSFDGSSTSLSVSGRRPFAPRTPGDLRLGDVIKYTRPDCRIARGVVKFIGHLHNKSDTFIGIETEYQDGKHDGVYDGSRYFQCKPNRGAFIPFNKVIMVWGV